MIEALEGHGGMTRKWNLTKRSAVLIETADMWVGLFWDRQKRRLYILPVPCLGLVLDFNE